MASKLLIIIATKEKNKALTALMYARNSIKAGWFSDVKVVFFGPSERLILRKGISEEVKELSTLSEVFACKTISDKAGISEDLEKLDIKVEYVGACISNFIKDGYLPMVW